MSGLDEFGMIFARLLCALAAGGVLGWERERLEKPAGLRTNMIVSLGSALLALVSLKLTELQTTSEVPALVDPSRILQGIIGGIGFLGAGSIIQSRHRVHGLTTASTLWLSMALGIASGLGFYALTIATVALGLTVLIVFRYSERVLAPSASTPPAQPEHDNPEQRADDDQ